MKNGAFRRLLGYAAADRRRLGWALGLLLLATAADVSGPILIKVFIDNHLQPGDWSTMPIAILAVAYVVLLVIVAWANYRQALHFNHIAVAAVQAIREQVFSKVVRLPLRFFDRTPVGNLISRITNDTEYVKELYVNVLSTYVQNSVRVVGIFVAMALLDWRLMLVCAVFLPVVAAIMIAYRRFSTPRFQRARSLLADINTRLHETLQGIKVVQVFNQQQRFRKQFGDTSHDHYRARVSNMKLDAMLLRPLVDLVHMIVLAGILLVFGVQSLAGAVEVGVVYAFINYLGRFVEPLIEMTQRLSLFQQSLVSGERVFQLMDEPVVRYPEHPGALIRRGQVEFDRVCFSYDGERQVITGLSFRLEPGEFFAIVGHTGSGKSTTASLLMRFYDPTAGSIRIDGQDLRHLSAAEIHDKIGIVQQDAYIFPGTVAENIAMGRRLSDEAIQAGGVQAGVHEWISALPSGYQTRLEEGGANLSAGQRQLVALARTLALRPRILVLDEATANVDSHTEAAVQQALAQLRGQLTMVVIAHRLSTIYEADQILVLHHGELAQQGTHRSLLTSGGLYRHLYQLQNMEEQMDLRERPVPTRI